MKKPIIGLCLFLQLILVQANVGLYNASDHVTILNGDHLLETITNSSTPWFVEYYSEWCGHCQDFAPIFKALAKDVAGWRRLVKIGSIDCSDTAPSGEENYLACSGKPFWVEDFPTFRMYPSFANSSHPGFEYKVGPSTNLAGFPDIERSVADMRNFIIDFVFDNIDQIPWPHDNPKPVFQPESFDNFMSPASPNDVMYTAYVIEEPESYMGKSIMLDVSSCSNLQVRRVISNTTDGHRVMELLKVNDNDLPFVVVKASNGTTFPVNVKMKTRYFYTHQLTLLPGVGEPVTDDVFVDTSPELTENLVDITLVNREKVYLADIESALRYALTMEIGSVKQLFGRKLESLKIFIAMFNKTRDYLPARPTTINFLTDLHSWIQPKTEISYQEWSDRVNLKTPDSYLPPTNKLWVGCQASKPSLRGYPCALWTLFHTMTVAAYNANLKDQSLIPDSMYHYITNFFSCRQCRVNFKKEVAKFPFKDLGTKDDAVLWLWRVHNYVNERLHQNSTTEDPVFPKLQFPTHKQCLDCYTLSGDWNTAKVTKYLIQRYSKGNVVTDFLNMTQTVGKGGSHESANEDNAAKIKRYEDFDSSWDEEELVRFHPRALGSNNHGKSGYFHGGLKLELGFTSMDLSLCLVVWFLSTVGAAFFCLALKLRRVHLTKKLSRHIL